MFVHGYKHARCLIRTLYGLGIAITTAAFMSSYAFFSLDFWGLLLPGAILLWYGAYGGWNDGET